MTKFSKSSIGRKYAMALSAFFLLIFLLQHLLINITSVFSPERFNEISQFMGYNPLVQWLLQPILIFAVVFHFVMGLYLEWQNSKARPVKYAVNGAKYNSSWVSRNMTFTGLVILAFLLLHFYDYFFPELQYKYVCHFPDDPNRFYPELIHKFESLPRTILYVISFVFLGLHLSHGFQSAFQSIGARHADYSPGLRKFGTIYSLLIPAGYIFIALFHYFNH